MPGAMPGPMPGAMRAPTQANQTLAPRPDKTEQTHLFVRRTEAFIPGLADPRSRHGFSGLTVHDPCRTTDGHHGYSFELYFLADDYSIE